MTKRVLVPVDNAARGKGAAKLAVELFSGSTLVLLHVIDPAEGSYTIEPTVSTVSDQWFSQHNDRAERMFDEIEDAIDDPAIGFERELDIGKPTRTIVQCARDHDIDHIVMCSHGRKGVSRLLLGSVAEGVVRRSPVSVTVARADENE